MLLFIDALIAFINQLFYPHGKRPYAETSK
jgi:hypothetical protein